MASGPYEKSPPSFAQAPHPPANGIRLVVANWMILLYSARFDAKTRRRWNPPPYYWSHEMLTQNHWYCELQSAEVPNRALVQQAGRRVVHCPGDPDSIERLLWRFLAQPLSEALAVLKQAHLARA